MESRAPGLVSAEGFREETHRRTHICEEAQGEAILAVGVMNHQICWPQCWDPQLPMEELHFNPVQLLALLLQLHSAQAFVPASWEALN